MVCCMLLILNSVCTLQAGTGLTSTGVWTPLSQNSIAALSVGKVNRIEKFGVLESHWFVVGILDGCDWSCNTFA